MPLRNHAHSKRHQSVSIWSEYADPIVALRQWKPKGGASHGDFGPVCFRASLETLTQPAPVMLFQHANGARFSLYVSRTPSSSAKAKTQIIG
jgi:hypothetical protein